MPRVPPRTPTQNPLTLRIFENGSLLALAGNSGLMETNITCKLDLLLVLHVGRGLGHEHVGAVLRGLPALGAVQGMQGVRPASMWALETGTPHKGRAFPERGEFGALRKRRRIGKQASLRRAKGLFPDKDDAIVRGGLSCGHQSLESRVGG